MLGVRAILGRGLTPADDQKPLAHPVAVISYGSWQRRFAADPGIVGRTIKINDLAYTILGVMPRDFFGTEVLYSPEFWVPMAMEPQIEPGNDWLNNPSTWNCSLLGRLRPGVTGPQAEAELNTVVSQLIREQPTLEGLAVNLSAPGLFGNSLRGAVIGFASVLMGVAGLVLLIACTNLASLLLARAADRRREIAIRLALGAGKWRLIRQLLAESLLLSTAGAAAGLVLAIWLADLIAAWHPPIDVSLNFDLAIDYRVLIFTAAAGLLTTVLFGLAPAIQSARTELIPALKNAAFTTRFRRWQPREFLVTAQIALSVVLLVATVLVVHSLQRALTINIGFNPQNTSVIGVDLGLSGYSEARGREFQRRLLEKIAALPGVQSAALANALPLGLDQSTTTLFPADQPTPKPSERLHANYYMTGPGYLHAMQTRLIAGRDFEARDRGGAPLVAIVNQALAHQLFPHADAIGKRVAGWGNGPTEIIGITEDGKYESLNDHAKPVVFWPILQHYNATTMIVARSALPPEQVVRAMQQAVRDLDPGLPFYQAGSLDDHLRLPLFPARLAASMLGAFGTLAIVLAGTGVYGVMAYAVSRRRREIGIRMAIGATRTQVMSLVLRRTVILLATGAAFGALAAFAIGGVLSPVLYGVSPKDPAAFSVAAVMIALVALGAAWLPARRAAGIPPSSALREE